MLKAEHMLQSTQGAAAPNTWSFGTQGLSSWRALSLFACSWWSLLSLQERLSEEEGNQDKVEARGGREAC